MFENYVNEVEKESFDFDKYKSSELDSKYINPITDFYSGRGFKVNMKLSLVVFWGVLVDILLLVSGLLAKIKYIPVTTLLLLLLFLYLQFFKKPNNLVYGIFY